MAVHERGVVGGDLHFENPDVFVFEGEMVIGFIGDFNFGSGLGAEENGGEQKRQDAKQFHRRGF
jgi:hypothetical protein